MKPISRFATGLFGASLLLALPSCNLHRVVRTEYYVEKSGILLVTNSEAAAENPKKTGEGRVRVLFPLILRNISPNQVASVVLSQAGFRIGDLIRPAACSPYWAVEAKQDRYDIPAGGVARIDCVLDIQADSFNHIASRDATGRLIVPVEVAGGQGSTIEFSYNLKVEDFE